MGETAIIFSTPKRWNPLSALIRRGTGAACSHTAFVYHDADFGMEMVMEAHELGFRLLPLERFVVHNVIVRRFDFGDKLDVGMRWAAQWLGSTYDYGGLFGMAWVMLGRWLKRRWRNPTERPASMFCSEIAARVLLESGVGKDRLDPAETAPNDLLLWLDEGFPKGGT